VFISANISNPFESLNVKICVNTKIDTTNTANNSNEKYPNIVVMIMNQKVNPAVTAILLNRVDDNSNLNRINECYQSTLS
jgi:hypothetical protein